MSAFTKKVVGFSFFYAVSVVFFYYSWLGDFGVSAALSYSNALNISICLAGAAVGASASALKTPPRISFFALGSISYLTAIVLQCVLLATSESSSPPSLIRLIAIFAGLGIGILTPLWFSLLTKHEGKKQAYACGAMSFFGMLIGMIVGLLPHPFVEIACALLLGASGWIYISHARGTQLQHHDPAVPPTPTIKPNLSAFVVPILCVLTVSITYGVLDTSVIHASYSATQAGFISQFGGLVAAAIFVAYITFSKSPAYTTLFNIILGILAAGLLFLPFTSDAYGLAFNIVAAAGWKLILLVFYVLILERFSDHEPLATSSLALAYALPRFGLLIGTNVIFLFATDDVESFVALVPTSFFLLYLILMTVWFINNQARKKAEQKAEETEKLVEQFQKSHEDYRQSRIADIAEAHHLTQREREVTQLLAEGRDLAYICSELYLSRNTVKSYTKSIYAKLNIHSKQELIDLFK